MTSHVDTSAAHKVWHIPEVRLIILKEVAQDDLAYDFEFPQWRLIDKGTSAQVEALMWHTVSLKHTYPSPKLSPFFAALTRLVRHLRCGGFRPDMFDLGHLPVILSDLPNVSLIDFHNGTEIRVRRGGIDVHLDVVLPSHVILYLHPSNVVIPRQDPTFKSIKLSDLPANFTVTRSSVITIDRGTNPQFIIAWRVSTTVIADHASDLVREDAARLDFNYELALSALTDWLDCGEADEPRGSRPPHNLQDLRVTCGYYAAADLVAVARVLPSLQRLHVSVEWPRNPLNDCPEMQTMLDLLCSDGFWTHFPTLQHLQLDARWSQNLRHAPHVAAAETQIPALLPPATLAAIMHDIAGPMCAYDVKFLTSGRHSQTVQRAAVLYRGMLQHELEQISSQEAQRAGPGWVRLGKDDALAVGEKP